MEEQKIKQLITAYATAIDAGNATAAANFLDTEFRVVLNNYKNEGKTVILSRSQYLEMLLDGRAGGAKRILSFLLLDVYGNAAIAKVKLEGDKTIFNNYYSLIRRNDDWLVVNDIPQIESK